MQYVWCPNKNKTPREDRYTQGEDGHMMTEEDWCDASTYQGIPTVASNNQKLGEGP